MKVLHRIARWLLGKNAVVLVPGKRVRAAFVAPEGSPLQLTVGGELSVVKKVRLQQRDAVVIVSIEGEILHPMDKQDDRTAYALPGEE